MASIRNLKEPNGSVFYPLTHERAVRDSNGVPLDSKLAGLESKSYVEAWDGASTPVVANIPAGVTVTYNTTTYTGTLAASASTEGKVYLVKNGNDYDRYITSQSGDTYSWVPNGSTEMDLSGYATDAELAQLEAEVATNLVNLEYGIDLLNEKSERASQSYFKNPFKVGRRYLIKNLSSTQTVSLYAFDSSYTNLGTLVKKNYISPNEEILITFGINNAVYIGGYIDELLYGIRIWELNEEDVKIDTQVGETKTFTSPNAGIEFYSIYPMISGVKYRVSNNTTTIVSVKSRYDATDDTTEKVYGSLSSGQSMDIEADADYNYIGGYCNAELFSISICPTEGLENTLKETIIRIDNEKESIGDRAVIERATAGDVYIPFDFLQGKYYRVTNTGNYYCSVNLKETQGGPVIQTIASHFNVGDSISFTAPSNAHYIGGYTNSTYKVELVSEFGLVPRVNVLETEMQDANLEIGQSSTFVKNSEGTLFSEYDFVEGKQYKVVNNSNKILSVFLRTTPSGENIATVASPLKPHYTVYFTAPANAKYIGGYSTVGYDITVTPIDGLENKVDSFSPVPSYYESYLVNKIQLINRLRCDCGGNGDLFIFITDTHLEGNALTCLPLLNSVSRKTGINKLIHGGDSCSITANSDPVYGWDTIYDCFDAFYKAIVGGIKGNGGFYGVLGNHDFGNRIYSGGTSEITGVSLESRRNILLSLSPDNIELGNSADGCYYYFDNKVARLRYIVLDSSYGNVAGGANIGKTQFEWFVSLVNATPNGYQLIVIDHIPFFEQVGNALDSVYVKFMAGVLCDINNKNSGTVTLDGETIAYDFSNTNTSILMYLFGHTHKDSEIFLNNVLGVSTINNGNGERYTPSYNLFESSPLQKVGGTISEQAFDVFVLNTEIIHTIRIGAGGDRHFHKQVITPTNGQDLSSLVEFITPTNWMSCDSSTLALDNSGDTPEWHYSNTILNVNNGVITLNGGTGDAMVVAADDNLNKEIFLIHI